MINKEIQYLRVPLKFPSCHLWLHHKIIQNFVVYTRFTLALVLILSLFVFCILSLHNKLITISIKSFQSKKAG